jgi:3-hydroxy-3-methylglutaryl CoA synthase
LAWIPPRAPGDALEYTAGSGGAAYILGPADEALAVIESSYSFVTDTPDFWRREGQKYPEHGQRFTGEPAYFKHITSAANAMMEASGTPAKIIPMPSSTSPTPNSRSACQHAGLFKRANPTGCWCR